MERSYLLVQHAKSEVHVKGAKESATAGKVLLRHLNPVLGLDAVNTTRRARSTCLAYVGTLIGERCGGSTFIHRQPRPPEFESFMRMRASGTSRPIRGFLGLEVVWWWTLYRERFGGECGGQLKNNVLMWWILFNTKRTQASII